MDDQFFGMEHNGRIPKGLPGGFFVYEAGGNEKIVFAGPNVIELYGCNSIEEFLEHTQGSFRGMVHPDDLSKIEDEIRAQTIYGEKRHDYVRYRIKTKQGENRYVEDFGHLLHSVSGKSYYFVFIVDVDQNEFYNKNRNSVAEAEILSGLQETDPLTGLLNMSCFYQRVHNYLMSSASWREEISFIHFDIPNFKLINERYGFNLGDELLCDLGNTIKEVFQGAYVSRFSDDHFVVCTAGNRGSVVAKVETVYKKMLLADDVNKKVRLKAGIYYMDDRRAELGLACDHARLACNSIKGRHDVNFCVYDDMLRETMRRQQYVIDHIDEAVENEYIKVFYQPVIRVKTGKICGYEALVRWVDPKYGMLSPADFIGTLEQYHLIHLIDTYVVKKVCEDYAAIIDAGHEIVPVSINISRLDFELCDIFGIIEKTREQYGMPRNMLDIEITESALDQNGGFIKSECDRMREMGYSIWIDDFGSGYSSLNTVAEYNFDVLKLDMIFMRSFQNNTKTAKLMTHIMDGARSMGVAPLCEGVETPEQVEFLKQIGCERAQGYFFGKPLPLQEARAMALEKGMEWEEN
ncbi:bifunctional diguanylate cyclase/phosphodiesterase [Butyrivibrio sp. VCB2006]|uniref:bifunctional diguanylate cyclase/phosphodiesterase n=1 Tax=Butyrivibrio sp. VCB2006 TaxID=1280679 RepID=UPI0004072A1E|nr:GGDEF and EAL domain-containing protein [Butyrivibrio sp. VCB2006]